MWILIIFSPPPPLALRPISNSHPLAVSCSFNFTAHKVQVYITYIFIVWEHPLEYSCSTRGHNLKENCTIRSHLLPIVPQPKR